MDVAHSVESYERSAENWNSFWRVAWHLFIEHLALLRGRWMAQKENNELS